MIKKLKRRYLITNMLLLSSTLLVCLAALFCFLYYSEIASSYSVMQEMIDKPGMPGHPPDNKMQVPTVQYIDPEDLMIELSDSQVSDQPEDGGGEFQWYDNSFNENQPPNWQVPPWPWMNPWMNPWVTPGNWNWDPNQGIPDQQQENSNNDPPPVQPEGSQPDVPDHGGQDAGAEPKNPDDAQHQPQYTAPPQTREHDSSYTQPKPAQPNGEKPRGERKEPVQTGVSEPQRMQESETRPPRRDDRRAAPNTTQPAAQSPATQTTAVQVPPANGSIDHADPDPQQQLVPVQEGQYIPDAYVAQIDDDGNIASYAGNNEHITDEEHFRTVHHAMDEVFRSGETSGTMEIGENSFRFLYKPDDSGQHRLVLLDRSAELSTLRKLLFIFALIAVIGLTIMLGISILLANWTVTPVAVAWEKQKQFVADASHELKTPLAVISANTEVILSDPKQSVAGQSKWLNYIQSETMRMSKLITNLLSVARMDSGKTHTSAVAPLALSETVSNICLVFEPIIYENGKTLNTIIQRNVTLQAEEDNVKQLLSILLDNAVLHSVPKAQITVSLSKDTQGKIRLSVANTAKDIPPEQLAHLFDRFYRIDTEGSPNGSGLGLSIARSIVRQMGGNLKVTSENHVVTFVAVFSP